MSTYNHQTFVKIAELAKLVEDNEKLSLPLFSVKLAKAHKQYPNDHTIGMVASIIERMANSEKLFIARSEIKDLYEKFYMRNSKFANVFAEELGNIANEEVQVSKSEQQEPISNLQINNIIDDMVDPVLASSLEQMFDANVQVKDYNDKIATKSAEMCSNIIKSFGFNNTTQFICGKQGIMVCATSFETPRGTTSILIPVETDGQKVFAPSVFVANAGSQDLNKDNIFQYLTSKAGQKLEVNANDVLQASINVKYSDTDISDVDLALVKMNSEIENPTFIAPQIMGVKVEEVNPNLILNVPEIKDQSFADMAKTFDSELGLASAQFGKQAVLNGHNLIASKLKECGFDTYNIAVASSDETNIVYAVSLNGGTVAFNIPVAFENKCALPPAILLCNGSISAFDKNSITTLLLENNYDRLAAMAASPLYGMKGSELINIVKQAVNEENYIKAENALNILLNSNDEKAYAIAVQAFNKGLTKQETIEAEPVSKCAMVIKNKHSQYDTCGHTGLPLHKVYQDKHGQCRPSYRKDMSDTYEGANFMNSKIYL